MYKECKEVRMFIRPYVIYRCGKISGNQMVKCKSIRYEEYLCRYIITGSFFYVMKVIIMQS